MASITLWMLLAAAFTIDIEGSQTAADRTFQIDGLLIATDGSPVSGVTVWFFPVTMEGGTATTFKPDGSGMFSIENPCSVTDAEGRFTIDVASTQIGKDLFTIGIVELESRLLAKGEMLTRSQVDFPTKVQPSILRTRKVGQWLLLVRGQRPESLRDGETWMRWGGTPSDYQEMKLRLGKVTIEQIQQ